jgi:phage terminase large subunit GpA-like protein
LSDWIEREMRLPEGVSSLPGRVRLWPYQREIADAITDPELERVTLVKSVRVGFTTLLSGAIASFVANEPSPILALLPTEADCRDYVVSDLEPIFEAMPDVGALLSGDLDEGGRNTLLSRRFPGGSLKVVAAKSPRNLRRHNVRVLLCDEVDAMEPTAEGSPLALAERRTLSFANRKIIVGSTPTIEETSNVLRAYARSDQRVFEVPCPSCGVFGEIMWAHIEWEPDKPETAAFRCPHCRDLVSERHKAEMVAAGQWRATAPDVKGHAGFQLSALVSSLPNAAWSKLAAEFLAVKDHPDQLQTFVNTILGQGWRESADALDEAALAAKAEPFGLDAIPAGLLFVTVGVDVQDDRLELVFVGHDKEGRAYIMCQSVIWGAPQDDTTWRELDEALKTTWPHPNGGTLRVDAAIVDSGDGGVAQLVYDFCRPRLGRRVFAGKGVAGFGRPPAERSKAKGATLILVGVDGIKASLVNRLQHGETIRFSDRLPPRFFEELTSERRVIRYVRGMPVRRFERIPGRVAEGLDATVYAMAARALVGVMPERRAEELSTPAASPQRSTVIRSRWMTR